MLGIAALVLLMVGAVMIWFRRVRRSTVSVRDRPLGTSRGQVLISPDFKAPLPKEIGEPLGE